MTTVAQMIEYLKTLPQEAEVQCGYENTDGYSWSMAMGDVDLNSTRVFDFTREERRNTIFAGKVIVEIHSGEY